jgi:hypothetical protein
MIFMTSFIKVYETPNNMERIVKENAGNEDYRILTAEPVIEEGKSLSYDKWLEEYGNTSICYRVQIEHPKFNKKMGATNYFQSWKGVESAIKAHIEDNHKARYADIEH